MTRLRQAIPDPPDPHRLTAAKASPDQLGTTLKLTIAGKEHKVLGGQVKRVELDLYSYGFSGYVEFVLFADKSLGGGAKDELITDFVKTDLITAELSLQSVRPDVKLDGAATPLAVKGLVTQKRFSEHTVHELKERDTLFRRYAIHFCDAAQLLFSHHFPCELYVKKTLKDVFDAHKGDLVTLSYDWDLLTEERPLIFLGHQPGPDAPSFYDFLIWLVDSHSGVFTHDYVEKAYKLSAEKDDAGTPIAVVPDDVAQLIAEFPALPRAKVNVLNSYSEGAKISPAEWTDDKVPAGGVRQDYLIRTPISAELDARVAQEKARMKARGPELRLGFLRFPQNALRPGDLVEWKGDDAWRAHHKVVPAPFAEKKMRVFALHVRAEALLQGPDVDAGFTQTAHRVAVEARLELATEKSVLLPAYEPPTYPRTVEGKVVSEEGEDKHETYQIYPDEKTSVDQYKVKIPLWADQIVLLDYQPAHFPGHFYFPAYKNQRVLVALSFDRAYLVRYLDWRAEGRLPGESQGNHLLLGKTPTTGVSIRHVYEDDKPVLRIKRTNEKDTALIQITEGNLKIKVQEDK